MISVRFQGKPFNITVIQVYAPTSNAEEAELEQFYEDLQDLLEPTPKKDVLFLTGDWNAKVGSQETPGVTGKFGLGIQNGAGQRLIEFCQENALVITNTLFQQHKRRLSHGHHQMVNTEIRFIIFFAAKDGEALYSQQKQHPVVDVTGDGSKVRCCKEQYCIGTWNIRSMNQGKLEVVKQKMARVNIDILGMS